MNDTYTPEPFDRFYAAFNNYNDGLFSVIAGLFEDAPPKILDLACGTGVSTRAISKVFPFSEILGIDIDANLIERAISSFSPPNVSYLHQDAQESIETYRDYDLVIVKNAFHLLKNANISLDDMINMVNKAGCVCLISCTRESIQSYNFFKEAELKWIETEAITQEEYINKLIGSDIYDIKTTSFGASISIPSDIFEDGIGRKQFSFLWGLSNTIITQWINKKLKGKDSIEIFQEQKVTLFNRT